MKQIFINYLIFILIIISILIYILNLLKTNLRKKEFKYIIFINNLFINYKFFLIL